MEYYAYIQVAAGREVLHIINCYLLPNSPMSDSEVLAVVLHQLDDLPTTEPVIMVGDFNAHLGGHRGLIDTLCPLHGEHRQQLQGQVNSRGRMLWSTVTARAMHVLNGCSILPMDMCTTCQ